VQRSALALFNTKGYEATALREIAAVVGVTKASLYYHFASKDEIVRSIVTMRAQEAERLAAWVVEQEPAVDLPERAVLRWIDQTPQDKLQGIRFLVSNPLVVQRVAAEAGGRIRDGLASIVDALAGTSADPRRRLLIRMALHSVNTAVAAATDLEDEASILDAARTAARALTAAL
jgi:AcrR family transcriptional regulator